ncbi:cation/H(+) antiporter 20 [Cynara cardunculus var. scolymus]|uniref:Cation/H+ exchanger n=1 Tax=Cynara cardunculus var. scolymus TaxID=59895 RepID=A0A103YI05_CYNCS|nr:cation/H(+) antiporter 20 [Cynara cardunculus var. scolymus]KVI09486.1 Cation/H+ exchanger [Cynara cardunculus var. scolymus]
MTVNITSIKTASDGVWQGDNPFDYAFPLLIVQTALVLAVSRSLAFLFKPLRQPKVIAEIVGGILLGPSALGRNQEYMHRIFPRWSLPILESVATIGLLFFLFLVGLELDLSSIRRSGKRAFAIAAAGISLPFILGIGVAFVLRKTIDGADKVGYAEYFVFMGVALSITAFPVLARILAELKLLTTRVGETAMAAAAFNDIVAWILLALAVALAGKGEDGGPHKSPLISVWVLLSGVAFVIFMMVVIRPAMNWVAHRSSPEHDTVDEAYICLTLATVMVSGFITDLIGIHAIFGAFIFGLTIPKGDFAEKLIERIEDFVSGLLLPLYFASSGLKTDVTKISGGKAWGLLAMVITAACSGKIFGTFIVAVMCMIPVRESLTLGLLMNTKGLVELIVLNIGKEKKVLNDEVFAILVLMALFTTFITTPTVMAVYKPARNNGGTRSTCSRKKDELRVLACVHGPGNISSLINLIESTRSVNKTRLKLYIMHLVELTERTSSIVMVQRVRRNGLPFVSRFNNRARAFHERVAVAFRAYAQMGQVVVRTTTAISALPTMHEDICHVAKEKRVPMVILPFHKRWIKTDGSYLIENAGHGWRGVNQRVLNNAPCSVAVLVDRGLGGESQQNLGPAITTQKACVMFFGGPDDRECLELGGRMVEHPAVNVTVLRFVEDNRTEQDGVGLKPALSKGREKYTFSTAINHPEKERERDEKAMDEFTRRWEGLVGYKEEKGTDVVESILGIGKSGEYDLIVVGKARCPTAMVARLADRQAEHAELGPVGDLLASSNHGIVSSVLVIQQHEKVESEEAEASALVVRQNEEAANEV